MSARNFYAGLYLTLVTTTVMGSLTPASASPNLILDGDFETNFAMHWQDEPGLNQSIGVVQGSDISGVTGSTAAMNNHFAFFGFPNEQAMLQYFRTVVGQEYVVTFDAGALGTGSEELSSVVTKSGNGADLGSLAFTTFADNDLDTTFVNYSYDFTATGTESVIFFAATGQVPNVNAILDNVSVTAVPEPATWELFVIGIGLVGFRLRRRAIAAAR